MIRSRLISQPEKICAGFLSGTGLRRLASQKTVWKRASGRKKDAKSADWRLVQQLTAAMLRTRSKDLQLAMWLTEANVKLHGFTGLREGLATVRELMIRFWDAGLYPVIEDGPEDRSGPFEWLNEKLVDSILSIPITRSGSGSDLQPDRSPRRSPVGSETQCKDENGDVDPQKKRRV